MSEIKSIRLLAAATEFNVSKETIIEFLTLKGFDKAELKPTSKMSEAMYLSLLQEFQGDKSAKNKADLLDIPKPAEPRVRKEDEVLVFKKTIKATPAPVAEPTPPPPPAAPPAPAATAVPVEQAIYKMATPTIAGLKAVGKINLEELATPKPPAKKVSKPKEITVPQKTVTTPPPVAPPITTKLPEEPPKPEMWRATFAKVEGPKVVGNIELPTTTPRESQDAAEKRKRKRIPIERKGGVMAEKDPLRTRDTFTTVNPTKPGSSGRYNTRPLDKKREEKEIDQKEIQEKIKETQAKLSGGGGRGKSLKAKYRRAKREELADQQTNENDDKKIRVTEFISVSELSNLMNVSFADVIGKCMSLGLMVSINQRLDAEVIELVSNEFGYTVEFTDMETQAENEEDEPLAGQTATSRPPIVTIMGHVDHGKTSLLDYIRSTNVVGGEAGGITQHIGAYEVTTAANKRITFLDTPGHEAFTAMRARGAKITDIAVIVIAADDAVMPQTKEAISHAQAANVPMIFAINKIDKEGANVQKIYEQLSAMNILVEEWGGKFQSQEISAKSGIHVDLLLDKILLEADLLELKATSDKLSVGTIIEASLDKGRGFVTTLLVQNGTLRQGDIMLSGPFMGKVKAMFNERNVRVTEALPSTPVLVLGLNGAPQAGEKFKVYRTDAEAKEVATKRSQLLREQSLRARKHITLDEIGRRLALGNFKELNLIIKGDVDGSVEALSDSLQKLSTEEIAVRVVHKGVGQISESDVLLATASDAILIGFNVRPSAVASKVAVQEGVEIKLYSIIYNIIDEIKGAMEGMLEPKMQEKIVANVEIKEVYKFDKATVAGCFVIEGKIFRNAKIRIIRDGIVTYPTGEGASAELGSLKRFKEDVKEVAVNTECGLTIKNYNDIKVGDIVEAFEIEEIKRTL